MDSEEISVTSEREAVINTWDTIIKPSEDKREYRGIELQNCMKVLLVSDPTTDKSAAALNVKVGSLNDPEHLPGLAHFCEHMLFLGTEKYPVENAYINFLSKHGGMANAYTDSDNTTYYFDVLPEYLEKTLDIFAQFFITPLFTYSCTDREIQAVNSENNGYMFSDMWRIFQINKTISDPKHPYSKFCIGSKETLQVYPKNNGINVREELLKFHSEWYSANMMGLMIFGKESLDELERIVIDKFSAVKNNRVQIPTWPQHPYTDAYRGIQINVVPIEDVRNLKITFPIPDMKVHYKGNPTSYISHLIGHEGPGSILSLLKENGWSDRLYCGPNEEARGFHMFDIDIDLTETGIDHIDDIVELVFQYINLIRNEGIQKWIFDEKSHIAEIEFRFKEKEDPLCLVVCNVSNLLDYPMEHAISANRLQSEWKPEIIQELLSKLIPSQIRVCVVGKVFESICDKSEKWYGTKYCFEKLSTDKIDRWSNCGLCEKIFLPKPNAFIPDCLELISSDSETKEFPTIIYNSSIMTIWYKQDNEYFLPKLNNFFIISSPIANSDPLNYGLNDIFLMLFIDSLNEYTYAAEIAGMNYYIHNNEKGLSIYMYGFNSKQHILLGYIMEKFKTFCVNPKNFAIKKEKYIRELKNFHTEQPHTQSFYYLNLILSEKEWSIKERLTVADAITIEKLNDFIEHFFKKVHVECLIHGNISKQKALDLAMIIEKSLPEDVVPLLPQQLLLEREIQLEKGSHYRIEIDHTIHSNSCILLYFQCGLQSTSNNILLQLLLNVINEPCFSILRTKEQLGYTVHGGIRCNNGVQGLTVTIQSNKHPADVECRIEAFLDHMDSYIINQNDEEFEKHRQSLISEKLERPKGLTWRSYTFLSEIINKQYHFDRVSVEVEALKHVTKMQLYDFYKEIVSISSPNRQKLGVHVISSAKGGAAHPDTEKNLNDTNIDSSIDILPVPEDLSKVIMIENVVAFKSGRALFPVVTPYMNYYQKHNSC